MINPDPSRITAEMWKLWEDRPNPAWLLSGIYADKKGYHNTVKTNQSKWPGNYSIILPLDLYHGNLDRARAIDLTMSDSEMRLWTSRMKRSAENPKDDRLGAVREFYGTLDNNVVFGMIKDSVNGEWRRSTADLTHLWHGHTSVFSAFVSNWIMLAPILSVWQGETFEEWERNTMLVSKGATGEEVKYWQYTHNLVRGIVTPASPLLVIDGDYQSATVAAFTDFAKKNGAQKTYVADRVTGWLALKYHMALVMVQAPKSIIIPKPTEIPEEKLKELVDAWLTSHIPGNLKFTGDIKGTIEL